MNSRVVAFERLTRSVGLVLGILCVLSAVTAFALAAMLIFDALRFLQTNHTPHSGWLHFSAFIFAAIFFGAGLLILGVRFFLRAIRII
jgi:hypothetical protein